MSFYYFSFCTFLHLFLLCFSCYITFPLRTETHISIIYFTPHHARELVSLLDSVLNELNSFHLSVFKFCSSSPCFFSFIFSQSVHFLAPFSPFHQGSVYRITNCLFSCFFHLYRYSLICSLVIYFVTVPTLFTRVMQNH